MAIKDIRANVYVVSKSQMYLQLSRENKGLKRFYYKLQSFNNFIYESILDSEMDTISGHLIILIAYPPSLFLTKIIAKIKPQYEDF